MNGGKASHQSGSPSRRSAHAVPKKPSPIIATTATVSGTRANGSIARSDGGGAAKRIAPSYTDHGSPPWSQVSVAVRYSFASKPGMAALITERRMALMTTNQLATRTSSVRGGNVRRRIVPVSRSSIDRPSRWPAGATGSTRGADGRR